MMKKNIILIVVLILLFTGCIEEDPCPIEEWPPFGEGDLEWFDFNPGDTVYFSDNLGNDSLFIVCFSREPGIDTNFITQSRCPGEGYLSISHFVDYDMISNFPHTDDKYLRLNIVLEKRINSVNIKLRFIDDEGYLYYSYWFMHRIEEQDFINPLRGAINSIGSVIVNDQEYINVFVISHSDDGEIHPNIYYDTLYYNKDGFLKFISSQHDYVLERLP